MAGGKSDYLEGKLLDHTFNKAAFNAPANVYVALYTAAPTDAGGGVEVAGGSYARVSTAAADWTRAGNAMSNANPISFPKATAGQGTPVAFGLFDAAAAGNLLYWGDIPVEDQREILENDTPYFPAGTLVVTED